MSKTIALCLTAFLAACGGSSETEVSEEAGALASQESALAMCGTTCPGGYHPTSYSCSYSCGSSCSPTKNVVYCDPNTGASFSTCGIGCPAGYRPTSYSISYSCVVSSNSLPNGNNVTYCARQ